MKVCIRCNPVSELQVTDEGLRCRIHGDAYVLEEQPDSVLVPFLDVDPPAQTFSEPHPGPQSAPPPGDPRPALPEQSPVEEPQPQPAPTAPEETPAE